MFCSLLKTNPMQDVEKEFKPTSWAIDNKVSIYVATVIICIAGIITYLTLPKENFPEVVFPQIYVATPIPGASPTDVENLVTKHIEKQVDFRCQEDVEQLDSELFKCHY